MSYRQTWPGAREFHVSKEARDFYQFDLSLFSLSGNVILADFEAARRFAEAMNAKRDLLRHPEQAVHPSQINAMGLIDELLHLIVRQYLEAHPHAMQEALAALKRNLGPDAVEQALRAFAALFPPIRVYRGEISLDEYLADTTEGRSNREIQLEEMLLLWMANANPAFAPFAELFDDETLERTTAYLPIIQNLETFFEGQPAFGQSGLSLFKTLRLPALQHPHSLEAQLEFLLQRFGGSLGRFYYRMLVGLDVIREEGRSFAAPVHFDGPGGGGGGESEMLDIRRLLSEPEPEAFSPDLDWMPRCVLIAKNTYVWLDQLSKKYRREIRTLDQIPEEELAQLQSWGVTGLWLIGLWERSKASARIKQRMGNPEAIASAYALYDYVIARELGGEEALEVLRQKAARHGLRLASDMVPNHVGIDGRWVMEHPDWFIQLPYPPYPSYTFNGPDLSSDERVGIFLEDHYYDKTDAAVVFKWVNRQTGEVRYIYHGNDGTAMPWNDTAQLNYLLPEVREAVIQAILHVARQFPIIRFDAAMTLAKRHVQRLWWPEPGGSPWGASVPSRAAFAMSKEDFDRAMPREFWREVVDRVAVEAPNTLLLAEAFWMMEGYFVRTLGMHRVYNSAFMNMLRDEKNAEYRQIVKNTLEFEPEILKRFVNFLNNPDEKTAIEQFGKGDKYFGVMTLCATLPGLPMLGHGQVEGLTERYGMEYRRAYYDEAPDEGLIAYHQQQIFPLLKKRHLFAEVENFVFYDAQTGDAVNEDVFVYSNRAGSERALVVYHNKNAETQVWVRQSVAQPFKTAQGRETRRVGLGQGLQLSYDARTFSIFRDLVTGLEHLHSNQALHEQGLYLELGPYQRKVFLDWREVYDADGTYARLAQMLSGRGVPSVDEARQELWLGPILQPFRALVSPALFRRLLAARGGLDGALREEVQEKLLALYRGIEAHVEGNLALLPVQQVLDGLAGVLEAGLHDDLVTGGALLGWAFTRGLGSPARLEEWRLGRVLEQTLAELGLEEAAARRAVGLTRLLLAQSELALKPGRLPQQMPRLLQDPAVQSFLGVNRFEGRVYFNREAHQAWLEGLGKLGQALYLAQRKPAAQHEKLRTTWQTLQYKLEQAALDSGFTVDGYLRAIAQKPTPPKTRSPRKASSRGSSTAETQPTKSSPKTVEAPRTSSPQDDLERIKGIGPKIAAALQAAGISTYAQLAKARESTLRAVLAQAGIRLAPSLGTWAKQASYLAKGDEQGLANYLRRQRSSKRGL
ncbi:alpha-amylase family glycosyl hydrolase [Meiothermus ruber]|uniref:Alpha amylase n=1 Tax=Meiothermus ruber (strain ATCC 35948 / DSM 1279 / VKM B-1258 / 21) TaxID=504728 RepID=D3PT06_MEIRD|nr:alpha-amylase family glycosyl hydrolase [Meiothermus ruber]ADD28589.1 alpha amylase catalytic region [Meiothermus ruber DSM 1279]AGK05967.1 alpha amylase [Meiothermus ruber DSM 1279]MCL6531098.1 alpha-amylase [Meiothermus ruber]GAO75529.1 alpha amylase [Meiothermus ruber H328]